MWNVVCTQYAYRIAFILFVWRSTRKVVLIKHDISLEGHQTPNQRITDCGAFSISPLSAATLSQNFCNLLRSMRLFNFWYNDVIKTTMTFRPFLCVWLAIYWQPSQNSGFTYFELGPWRAGQWLIVSLCASYIIMPSFSEKDKIFLDQPVFLLQCNNGWQL